MARPQQQQILFRQSRRIDDRRLLQRMTEGHEHDKGFLVDGLRQNSRFVERQRQNQHIQIAGLKPFTERRRVILLDLQRHIGRTAMQARDQMRQQVGANRVDHPQSQHADQVILPLRSQPLDDCSFLQHPLRLFDDAPPDGRYSNLAGRPLEQRHA